MYFPLKAITPNKTEIIFTIQDIPKNLDGRLAYLAARPDSELFITDTIARGSDILDKNKSRVFERDLLRTATGDFYFVLYDRGFKFYNRFGVETPFMELDDFVVVSTITHLDVPTKLRKYAEPSWGEIRFKEAGSDIKFRLTDIVYVNEGVGLLYGCNVGKTFEIDKVLQAAGVRGAMKERLYFGEVVYGGYVVDLLNGQVVLTKDDEVIDASNREKLVTLV